MPDLEAVDELTGELLQLAHQFVDARNRAAHDLGLPEKARGFVTAALDWRLGQLYEIARIRDQFTSLTLSELRAVATFAFDAPLKHFVGRNEVSVRHSVLADLLKTLCTPAVVTVSSRKQKSATVSLPPRMTLKERLAAQHKQDEAAGSGAMEPATAKTRN